MNFTFTFAIVLLSFAMIQQASADLTIRLTGSTAFRAGTHRAIISTMGTASNCRIAHGAFVGNTTNTQADFENADYSIVRGVIAGIPGTTTVHCSWRGSATGIIDVSQNNSIPFLAASQLPTNPGYASAAVSQTPAETAAPNFALSDVYLSWLEVSPHQLDDNVVAVVPFSWVANEGTTGITNITQQLANALYNNGTQPKKLFTADDLAVDADHLVLAVGTNTGCGTRINQLAETHYGVYNTVQQWKLTNSGTTITTAQVWPENDGVGATITGNGGYVSGSLVRNFLGWTSTSVQLKNAAGDSVGSPQPLSLIALLGMTDSITAVANGAVRLSYNGVLYDASNPKLIYQGLYTAWSYLHVYTHFGLSPAQTVFRDRLASQFDDTNVLGLGGLRLSQMQVGRVNDGAVVGP